MLLITTKYYFQYILSLSNQLVLSLKLQLKFNLYTQLNDTYLDQPQLFHTHPDNIGVRLGFWRVNCHGVFGYMSLHKPRPLSSWTAHLTDSDYLTTKLFLQVFHMAQYLYIYCPCIDVYKHVVVDLTKRETFNLSIMKWPVHLYVLLILFTGIRSSTCSAIWR